jgi:hypothetical protein
LAKLNRSKSYGWRVGHLCGGDDLLQIGAKECLRRITSGAIPYFDELDAISLVVVGNDETVCFKSLVEHNECCPGGQKHVSEQSVGTLHGGSKKLLLYLAEGETRDDLKLKEWPVDVDVAPKDDAEIMCRVEITPGQGLAIAYFVAPFLERQKLVDIGSAVPSDMTRIRIERELKRHFPPTMPYVEACNELWNIAEPRLREFANSGVLHDNGFFAMAQDYWGIVNPFARASSGARRYGIPRTFDDATMSPIDFLKRENVFGNNPQNSLPSATLDFNRLFRWLYKKYTQLPAVLRLIAWTYQPDEPAYEPIRQNLYVKYVINNGKLGFVELSFCSNNFSEGDIRVRQILKTALLRIAKGTNQNDELRLAYNLMQFHPSIISDCESGLCESAFNSLVEVYNKYDFYSLRRGLWEEWGGPDATKKAGYLIKCMLFVLHRRRYDSEFLRVPKNWKLTEFVEDGKTSTMFVPPGQLKKPIPCKHESMRKSLVQYVNGRGTLDGIPSN